MNLNEFKKMSAVERFQAMEALWDTMLYENQTIDVPEWHNDLLTERKKKIEAGTAMFISLAELKALSGQ